MELRQKFKIIVWTFVFLLILNVSTILLVLSKENTNRPIYPPPNDSNCFNNHHGNMPMPQAGLFSDLIISELKLSDEQIAKFTEIRQNFMFKSHEIFDSINFYNNLIDIDLQNYNLDTNSLYLYSKKIGDFHALLKINFVNYYLDIENILTQKQSQKLYSIFIEFKQQNQFNNSHQGPPRNNNFQGNRHRHGNPNAPF